MKNPHSASSTFWYIFSWIFALMFGAPFCFVGIILMISIIGFPLGLILIGFSGFPLKIVESHRITKIVAWNKFTEPSDLDEFINMPTPWEK